MNISQDKCQSIDTTCYCAIYISRFFHHIAGQGLEASMLQLDQQVPTTSTPKRVKPVTAKCLLCEHCGKSFTTQNGVSFHISMEHLDKPKFRCRICSKKFMSKSSYQTHTQLINATCRGK